MSAPANRVSRTPLLAVGLGVLFIIVALFWFLNSSEEPAASSGPDIPQTSSPRIPYPNVKRVNLADVKAAVELKQAVILDTRGEPFFSEGHIPSAISFTEEEFADRVSELDRSDWIITYCT